MQDGLITLKSGVIVEKKGDDFNQQLEFKNSIYPMDRVKNFTIQQIETETIRNRTFLQLKNDLYRNYNNPTKDYLDELFDYWN